MEPTRPSSLLFLTLAGLAAATVTCEETETTVVYALCDPVIESVSPADTQGDNVVSTEAGTLTVQGRYLWLPSPVAAPAEEATPEPVSAEHGNLPDVQVLVGGRRATVSAAYDLSLPGVTGADLTSDGAELQETASDCLTCATCMQDNDNGCGGCTTACAGCVQVVTFEVPLLLPGLAGTPSDDDLLDTWIEVITSTGHSNRLSYSFPPACTDGIDNDGDGAVDDADDACRASPWSERPPCEDGYDNDGDGWIDADDAGCAEDPDHEEDACGDGIDNDGDGWIDLEDPACAGDPRGRSENTTTEPPACSNGIDDDGDTRVDAEDSRCSSGTDTDESQ